MLFPHTHIRSFADHFGKQADLTQNTSLRDFHFEGSPAGVLSSLPIILPQLSLCGTENISLTIRRALHPEGNRMISTHPWSKLDRELLYLKRLTLEVVEPLTRARRRDISESILKQLPSARARGIVAF
jgi:hypothetical protein